MDDSTSRSADIVPPREEPEALQGITNVTAIFQKIEQLELKIENLHMPMALPSATEAAALRSNAPEMYEMILELSRKNAESDSEVRRLPYEHSFSITKRGQVFGIVTVLVVFSFCGYLASLGGAGPYIAGILGTFNFASTIGVFMAVNRGRQSH